MNRDFGDYGIISQQFSKKYCEAFEDKDLQEDVTQPYWKSMDMLKKRLKQLGISKKLQIHENGMRSIKDTVIDRQIESMDKGNAKITMINTPVSVRSRYYLNDKLKYENKDYHCRSQCMVLESDEEITEYICPNCGALGTKESFIDGCDYCGTKFQVGKFDMKISAYNVFHDYEAEEHEKKAHSAMLMLVPLIIAIFTGVLSMASFFSTEKLAIEVMCQKISSVIFMIVAGIFVVLVIEKIKRSRDEIHRVVETNSLRQLESDMPSMNREDFAAALDYKMKKMYVCF